MKFFPKFVLQVSSLGRQLRSKTGLSALFHDYRKICSFPATLIWPVEGKYYRAARIQLVSREVHNMHAQRIAGVRVRRILPAVHAPMHHGRRWQNNSQLLAFGHGAAFVIEAPLEVGGALLVDKVALDRLRGLVEDFPIAQGAAQLDV